MPEVINFRIERTSDEQGVYYMVMGVEVPIATGGVTLEETLYKLREAVALYYDGDNAALPRIEVSLEVTEAYG